MNKEISESGANLPEKQHYHFNEYAVDWPLNGDEERLANDIVEATLKSLNEGGDAETLSIGKDVRPRTLKISQAFSWFERVGYFYREDTSIKTTEKWRSLFIKEK